MMLFHERLRGSLHPDTAQERLDYWQGIYRGRTAMVALEEAKGTAGALGGIGPIPSLAHNRIERCFDDLIVAQVAFARFQLKQREREAASAVTPAAPADHTAESPRPRQ